MKRIILALGLILAINAVKSQELPYGYNQHESTLLSLTTYAVPTQDQEALVEAAEANDKLGKMSMYGNIIDATVNADTHGRWSTDAVGNLVWQFKFSSPGAKAVALLFDNFYLPEGSVYYIYSADRSWFEGPFDFTENHPTGIYRSADAFGEEAIFEYVQPADVVGTPRLGISGIINYYRFIEDLREDRGGLGTSDNCQIDVNCPEGTNWVDQRQAVVRLSIVAGNGVGFCTGTLVNNTNYDCKNYILTAMHCTEDSSNSNLLSSTVRFNFQRANCGSGSAPMSQQKVGLILRADSNDNGGTSGSDFALVEMDDTIPSNWNPYYAGWDATTSAPTPDANGHRGFCIHHPSGDAKKFSTAATVTNGNWVAPGNHWRVVWTETQTNWGVTEGGSSGSPLFNKSKRIVGTLTGGGSFCDALSASDYYGKMERHFYGNPNTAAQELEEWLDPNNSGLTAIDGSYVGSGASPCTPQVSSIENELKFDDVKVFPAIASDVLTINTNFYQEISQVRIFNAEGRMLDVFNLNNANETINVSNFPTGVYFIAFVVNEGTHLTKKFTVVR